MTTTTTPQNRIQARLEASGRRSTPQRDAVIAALVAHGGHPTAMEVRDLVWQQQPEISQATVYNTLGILEEIGVVQRLEIAGDEHTHYEVDTTPHINLVCTRCGRIVDVYTDTLEALLGLVASRSGFAISSGAVMVYGLCQDCRARAE